MSTEISTNATAAPLSTGGRHAEDARFRDERRSDRGHDSTRGVGDPAELVAGRGVSASSDEVRLHAAGRGAGERADALRRVAARVAVISADLVMQCTVASARCSRRLALNESIDLTTKQRIAAGDLEVIHDLIRDAIDDLDPLADLAGSLLCDDPDALRRLAEVRRRQERTGRQWCRPPETQETDATDSVGKEPRGPGMRQDKPPQAKAGKRARRGGTR